MGGIGGWRAEGVCCVDSWESHVLSLLSAVCRSRKRKQKPMKQGKTWRKPKSMLAWSSSDVVMLLCKYYKLDKFKNLSNSTNSDWSIPLTTISPYPWLHILYSKSLLLLPIKKKKKKKIFIQRPSISALDVFLALVGLKGAKTISLSSLCMAPTTTWPKSTRSSHSISPIW